jgi:hypothetical protein
MNKQKLTEIGTVALCGLIGGLLAWLLGIDAIASAERVTSLVAALLGGAIAAGVGVYLIAHTDMTTVAPAIFFASLCGLSWQAVLATGNSLVQKAIVQSAITSTKDANKTLTEPGQTASDENIKSVANNAVKVVDKLPGIESSQLKTDARQSVTDAIKTLKIAAPTNPQAATEALGEIAKRADESGSTHVKGEAVTELKEIAKNEQKFPEEARKNAASALEQIGAASEKK